MQPTFFPWAGYFRLIAMVDCFVYLDNVQLLRQSWQTRNRVLVRGAPHWLIAAIQHTGMHQTIAETRLVADRRWRRKMASLLRHEYGAHPHFTDLRHLVHSIENGEESCLADLNIAILDHCIEKLEISTRRVRSSELNLVSAQRTTRLIEICKSLDCNIYVSPIGASTYLAEDRFTEMTEMALEFFNDVPPSYPQVGAPTFVSHLSVIDLIANLGWAKARDYIKGPWPSNG